MSIFTILGIVCYLVGFGCSLFILIEAFRDEVWKGLLCFFCGLYGLYWAIFEWDHENKWLIILGSIGGSGAGAICMQMALRKSIGG